MQEELVRSIHFLWFISSGPFRLLNSLIWFNYLLKSINKKSKLKSTLAFFLEMKKKALKCSSYIIY